MAIGAIQHINIRCVDADRTRAFYVDLGLVVGDRPPFASQGYWLYAGAHPVVHLVQKRSDERQEPSSTGGLDHIAFAADDLTGTRAALDRLGLSYREALVPRDNVVQILVHDPDGVQIELNFAQH